MIFIELILFILIGTGITNIVVNASILDKVRDMISERSGFLKGLFECMLCSGFWVGAILSTNYAEVGFVSGGAIISLMSYTFGSLMDYIHTSVSVFDTQIEQTNIKEE